MSKVRLCPESASISMFQSKSVLPDPEDDDDQIWWDNHVCQFTTEYCTLLSPSDQDELFNNDANDVETEMINDVETKEDPSFFSDDDDQNLVKIMKKSQPQSLIRNNASLVSLAKPMLRKSMSSTCVPESSSSGATSWSQIVRTSSSKLPVSVSPVSGSGGPLSITWEEIRNVFYTKV